MGNQFLTLGMFIMLLSFFIVLNTLSGFEEGKAQAVMESLAKTLTFTPSAKENLESDRLAEEGDYSNEGDNLDKLNALFSSTIPGIKAQKNRFGTQLTVDIPQDEFESLLNSSALNNDTQRFKTTLKMLVKSTEDIAYKMDVIVLTEAFPPKQNQLIKAGSYSYALEQSGIPPKLISAGVARGEQDIVRLIFEHYTPLKIEVSSQ